MIIMRIMLNIVIDLSLLQWNTCVKPSFIEGSRYLLLIGLITRKKDLPSLKTALSLQKVISFACGRTKQKIGISNR